MSVTTSDIEKVLAGGAIEIMLAYPLTDRGESPRWFMKQPSDWVYDMSIAMQEAAEAEMMAQPEMEGAKKLPPSDYWMSLWDARRAAIKEAIATFEGKGAAITPEESIELAMRRDDLENMADPGKFSRADEIARREGTRARDLWIMPRLIVDEQGKLIFDPGTEEGRTRWEKLGRRTKDELRVTLNVVLSLVQIAKNS